MTEKTAAPATGQGPHGQLSLSTEAARNLATTTKSAPQMQGITSRWLLRTLPWVNVSGGTYRVNRRLKLAVGRGRVRFEQNGADDVRIIPATLREIPILHCADDELLAEMAAGFAPRDFRTGQVIVEAGSPIDEVFVIAHGKVGRLGTGPYGDPKVLGMLADGDYLGEEALHQSDPLWLHTFKATTAGTLLALPWSRFQELYARSSALQEHIAQWLATTACPTNTKGEADIELSAGHQGEEPLPGTFVDYELAPREYELSLTQTVLRMHSRVADLYNDPMNQLEHQLRLTIEGIRERQEWELLNNREFGLLHNTDYDQRISTWSGPPTPDDLDDLLTMRRGTNLLFAHPRTIAAFFRECNRRGLAVDVRTVDGHEIPSWRGVPLYPCSKIEISEQSTGSIIAMRTGEDREGVIGLYQTGIPDEYEPGLNVRFMGIDDKAIMKYLVSAYYSVAVLVPDAVGILENAEVAAPRG